MPSEGRRPWSRKEPLARQRGRWTRSTRSSSHRMSSVVWQRSFTQPATCIWVNFPQDHLAQRCMWTLTTLLLQMLSVDCPRRRHRALPVGPGSFLSQHWTSPRWCP
eukprot:PhF_6_TR31884/c1_g1_i7/m.47412